MDKYIERIIEDSIKNFPHVFPVELTDGIKLELTGVIGGGGFSNTYQGKYYDRKYSNLSSGKDLYTEVIVKEFFIRYECKRINDNEISPFDKNKFSKYLDKFQTESEILKMLNHPYIVDVFSKFDANGTSYYVMKKIDGLTLNEYVANHGCMYLEKALKILTTAMDALRYVHNSNFLHLDIKPDNMITSETGSSFKTYLIDFGLCKSLNSDTHKAELSGSNQAGSPGYSPQELSVTRDKNGELIKLDAAADIYSLGATLYFLLTGKHPEEWGVLSTNGLVYPAYADPRGKLIFKKAMQIFRKNRPQNVDQFVALCNEALKQPLPQGYDVKKPIIIPNDEKEILANSKRIKLTDAENIPTPVNIDSISEPEKEDEPEKNDKKNTPSGYETEVLNPNKETDTGKTELNDNGNQDKYKTVVMEKQPKSKEKDSNVNGGKNTINGKSQSENNGDNPPSDQNPVHPDSEDNPNVKKGSSKWNKYVKYMVFVCLGFGVMWGVFNWRTIIEKAEDTDIPTPVKADSVKISVPGNISDSELTDSLKLANILWNMGKRGPILEKYLAPDAYYLITNGTDLIGSPTDPQHTLEMMISNNYIVEGYEVVDKYVNKDTGLIECLYIQKKDK